MRDGFRSLVWFLSAGALTGSATCSRSQDPAQTNGPAACGSVSALQQAARSGDVAILRSRLQLGDDPNARDQVGCTPLLDAVSSGHLETARVLVAGGAHVNAASPSGRTPLIEAAEGGRADIGRFLVQSGADLDAGQRGFGTALETAERTGHNDFAAMLRGAGARSSGRSVGDTVCVRPWKGDGYCGAVESVEKTAYRIRIRKVVGCKGGCAADAECSAGRPLGGPGGLQVGDVVATVSWCLTHTGVRP
jgi:hypothetical protein